ncbi:cobyrinic acid a,c-diamide synthase [Thermosipho affectus]|uniref:Cobyrinic acid a,c-diamide synthase n=1 Tax=Thermosipho affectus TaxID=660294 RepID=A0ABX3IJB9_9BACT|nr:P-loop NTPase [Thermosipho affectus]ONN26758.1 cobyrinic acid a,c-diamide synthase [Thermosipho affectus]
MLNQARNLLNLGNVILVGSGKGGVGKTLITVNLSIILKTLGFKVLIFDLDVGFTNSDVLLNVHPKFSLSDLIMKKCEKKDVIYPTEYGVDLVNVGNDLETIFLFNENNVKEFYINFAQIAQNYDFILIDLPPGYNDNFAPFFNCANSTLVITTTQPTSLVNSYTFVKILIHKGVPSNNIHLVGNLIEQYRDSLQNLNRFSAVLEKFTGEKIGSLTLIKKHPTVEKSVYDRKPFVIDSPKIQPTFALYRIASILTKKEIPQKETILEKLLAFFKGVKQS